GLRPGRVPPAGPRLAVLPDLRAPAAPGPPLRGGAVGGDRPGRGAVPQLRGRAHGRAPGEAPEAAPGGTTMSVHAGHSGHAGHSSHGGHSSHAGHDHGYGATRRRLAIAFGITTFVLVAGVVG